MRMLFILTIGLILTGCSSNPHKAEEINTKIDKSQKLSGQEKLGLKEGNMVIQKKVQMNEQIRSLQNEVYSLEDRVYGNRKYGSQGLYGALKTCRKNVTSKKNGGNGKLLWTEPLDRITDKEDEWTVGVDEKDKIVGISEEFLKDRIKRFRSYKMTLQKREDEYKEKLEICDAKLESQLHELKKKKSSN